jgi:hypothetical protein
MDLYHASVIPHQDMKVKIPWHFRVLFTSISVLAFYFAITSNSVYTLAGLGITGVVAGLDLVVKGVEVGVDGLRFLEAEIRRTIITRHILG